MTAKRFFSSVLMAVGIFLFLFGMLWILISTMLNTSYDDQGKQCIIPVTATVVEMEKKYSSDTGYTYAPVFFYIIDGYEFTVHHNTSTNPPLYTVGEQVEIKFNPDNPSEIIVPSEEILPILAAIFQGVGMALIGIGMFFIILAIRKKRKLRAMGIQDSYPEMIPQQPAKHQTYASLNNRIQILRSGGGEDPDDLITDIYTAYSAIQITGEQCDELLDKMESMGYKP